MGSRYDISITEREPLIFHKWGSFNDMAPLAKQVARNYAYGGAKFGPFNERASFGVPGTFILYDPFVHSPFGFQVIISEVRPPGFIIELHFTISNETQH